MSADGPPPLAPGVEIAPGYRLIEHLSRGRTLDVHDAWSEARGTRCIVKALRPDRDGDAAAARRLLAEGRLIRRLTHPHIVRGYETLTEPRPLVVMETLTGQTLAHLIDESPRRLPVAEIAHLGLHLGSAIRYLHGEGWLHLDLKPSNVIAEAGRAKLIDMSVARRPGRSAGGVGTWCYMAPEQITGGRLGPAADVWGLGTVLYEATTGRAAFDPPGPHGSDGPDESGSWTGGPDRRHLQLDGPPTPIRRLRRVPAALVELIDACLDPVAGRRPGIDAVLAALEPPAGLAPRERRFAAAPAQAPGTT
jgi:serine/threonine protein kinase